VIESTGLFTDREPFDLCLTLVRGAKHVPADAAKAVDPDSYRHGRVLPFSVCGGQKECRTATVSVGVTKPID
jgi:hypothetical protein